MDHNYTVHDEGQFICSKYRLENIILSATLMQYFLQSISGEFLFIDDVYSANPQGSQNAGICFEGSILFLDEQEASRCQIGSKAFWAPLTKMFHS